MKDYQERCDKNKSKIVPELNYAPHHEDVWGSGGIAPPFLIST
jgi:hypothetical protein